VKADRAYNLILGACGLITAACLYLVARREFKGTSPPILQADVAVPVFVPTWRDLQAFGSLVGRREAYLHLVVFSDLECPFCRRLHQHVDRLIAEDSASMSMTFIHSPIATHRFAEPAARAAECTKLEHQFPAMLSQIFKKQDSLGLITWEQLAIDVGIQDLRSFERCRSATAAVDAIEKGRLAAEQMQITGTPTVLVNGWRLGAPPGEQALRAAIEKAKRGESVY
jgi:protein-disulfide isomerase